MSKKRPAVVRIIQEWAPVIIAVLLIRSFLVEAFMVPTGSMEDTIAVGDFMLVNKFIYGIKMPFTDHTIIPISEPKPGDIIVFRFPVDPDRPQPESRYARLFPKRLPLLPLYWDKQAHFFRWHIPRNFIKRCVAVAGDTVEYKDKQLYVNGKLQFEPYAIHTDIYRMLPGLDPPPPDFQRSWEERRFYQSALSRYIRDQFGPIVVPEGHIFCMGDNRDNSADARFWGPLDLRYIKGKPLVLYMSSAAAKQPVNILKIVLSPWAIRLDRIGKIVR
ncbi:signal peptidase I [candidate division WOR-3 bacterium JGI_Cruoil_03_51_56]|uniref:Signal peptidase I n=1 Tax=candidate division WOR-3 bacterium JGI_Cruoil_03_51_56 TaxID=1973747 RepID=A0A235BVN8_UNCW3|nr:MAG: signal peptidase I [candidate division WOR-3 bacterium JGI_Cruoil_03_51_56]